MQVSEEKISFSRIIEDEYRSWTVERRLQWLFIANKLRRDLPKKTIEIQEAFRQGKI